MNTNVDDDTPYFWDLYNQLQEYEGSSVCWEVLDPWMPDARKALSSLEPYRQRNSDANSYAVTKEDLWQWYALNRVNDYLLTSFQAGDDFWEAKRQQRQAWRKWLSGVKRPNHALWDGNSVHPDEYADFFTCLGFTLVEEQTFHPFYHEIVEVEEMEDLPLGETLIDQVCWPGLLFGEMLFSRAGVRVACHPQTLDKRLAESSRLYFTFWRLNRETADLSRGWGHNSQWRTSFRRDYVEKDQFHFNVDGKYLLRSGYEDSLPGHHPNAQDDLALDERIELLTHRCFVTCTKDDTDRWPYEDTYTLRVHGEDRAG